MYSLLMKTIGILNELKSIYVTLTLAGDGRTFRAPISELSVKHADVSFRNVPPQTRPPKVQKSWDRQHSYANECYHHSAPSEP